MELRPPPQIKNYIHFKVPLNIPFNFSGFMCSCLIRDIATCLQYLFAVKVHNPAKMINFKYKYSSFIHYMYIYGGRSGVMAKALHYKPAGRGFDSRWCH
jgi:hypothetical protein